MASKYELDPEALSRIRKKQGLTQGQLATKAKLSQRTVAECERLNSKGRPTQRTLEALAKGLGVKVNEICKDAPPDPQEAKSRDDPTKNVRPRGHTVEEGVDATTVRITSSSKNNFVVLKEKYGVTRDEVVEFSPIMFAILADMSLEWRKRKFPKWVRRSLGNKESALDDYEESYLNILNYEIFERLPGSSTDIQENAFGYFLQWLSRKWNLGDTVDWVFHDEEENYAAASFEKILHRSITDRENRIPTGCVKMNFHPFRDVEVIVHRMPSDRLRRDEEGEDELPGTANSLDNER